SPLPVYLDATSGSSRERYPPRRYPGALVLADDCAAYLEGRSPRARPAGRAERLLKWSRRRPAAALLVLLLLAGALAAGAGAGWHHLRLRAERDRAERNVQTAWRAVDEMLPEVVVEQLAVDPRLGRNRRLILERALALY